jgi:hypothetical protein
MIGLVEFLKWYSIILVSMVEIAFIYNLIKAVMEKEKKDIIVGVLAILFYLPLLFLCVWAMGHGYY